MSMHSRLVTRALQFAEQGNHEDARQLLQAVIREDPSREGAWFQYLRTLPTLDKQIDALRWFWAVKLDDRRAQTVLAKLWERKLTTTRPAVPPARSYRLPFYVTLALLLLSLSGLMAVFFHLGQEVLDFWSNEYSVLAREHDVLQEERDSLLADLERLRGDYTSFEKAQEILRSDYRTLDAEHDALQMEHQELRNQYDTLSQNYSAQKTAYDQLSGEHRALQQEYNSLLEDYDWLDATALIPPYISIQGRNVEIMFERSDGRIDGWEVSFEALESSLYRGAIARADTPELSLSNEETGELHSVVDLRGFVDPTPFTTVMTDLYWEMDSDYDFIYETWFIVQQLTVYSSEVEETPRYPLETFLAGGGDCEDKAVLFASMIKAAPVDWNIEIVYMDSYHPRAPRSPNHVVIGIDTGNERRFIETVSTGQIEFVENVRGWFFEVE